MKQIIQMKHKKVKNTENKLNVFDFVPVFCLVSAYPYLSLLNYWSSAELKWARDRAIFN